MLKAWKYVGRGKVLLLARENDFSGVPSNIVASLQGVRGTPWGDRPGQELPDNLIGADRATIEQALASKGWFSS